MTIQRTLSLAFSLTFLLTTPIASAQPFALDENIKPLELTLKEEPNNEGILWTGAHGTIGAMADYLFVNGLSPRRVVEAHVIAINAEEPVSLTVVKNLWSDPGQSCDTGSAGMCKVKFRTSGDAGIRVDGVNGSHWRLLLLASPEVPLDLLMPSPMFEARKADAAQYEHGGAAAVAASTGSNTPATTEEKAGPLVWIAAAGVAMLGIIAVLLAKVVRNSGGSAARMLLPTLVVLTACFAIPHSGIAYAAEETDSESIDIDLSEIDEAIEREAKEREEAKKRIDEISQEINRALKLLIDARKVYDTWFGDLSNCSAMGNPAGTPRIPSFCEGNVNCKSCYANARKGFNETRHTFEQLRIIYSCNKRAIDAAIKFGDGGSAVHGVTALAWQTIKLDIETSVKKMKQAYDNKYAELGGRLHDSMIDIAMCEARYGEKDWYDRFGYVYYEFMMDKYKRTN